MTSDSILLPRASELILDFSAWPERVGTNASATRLLMQLETQ